MSKFREVLKTWRIYNHLPFIPRSQKVLAGFLDVYHLHLNESIVTNTLAVLVGILAGFSSFGFILLIGFFQHDFFPFIQSGISSLTSIPFKYVVIIIPAIGGLIIAPIIFFLCREARGTGVPEVIESVALRGGRLRFRIIFLKALTAAICIGSGGSVGRHGPSVHIGSAIGSIISGAFHMSTERRRWLVACGAAGGIAATFNAPIAGVIFAMEVILRQATLKTVTSIILASVAASAVSHYFLGDTPAFSVPSYSLVSWWELLLYLLLGITGAFVALLFSNSIYVIEDIFERFKLSPLLKPAIGGLLVGVIILFLPQVQGVGYETIEQCLRSNLDIQIVLLLIFFKIIATAFTLGSGGSGGVFAPSLFIGAMFGGAFGLIVPYFYHGQIASPGAYALVGMGTVFAGSTRAPLTAILILFEMTKDYDIILPLMISVVMAGVIANHFQRDSIYTFKLTRRGTQLFVGHDLGILSALKAKDVMITDIETIQSDMTLGKFREIFSTLKHHALPVLQENKLVGLLTYNDYLNHKNDPDDRLIRDICSRRMVTANEDDDLRFVLSRFMPRDVRMVMVVDKDDNEKLIGILTRTNIFDAYRIALKRKEVGGEDLINVMPPPE